MQRTPNQTSFVEDVQASGNLLFLLVNGHATCLTIFIRHSFGESLPGFTGVVSALMLLALAGGQGDPLPDWFLIAWLVMLIVQRILTARLIRRGWREHSYYSGWPWLGMLCGARDEIVAKKMEPVICFVLGLLLVPLSPTLGGFVMCGVVSLFAVLATQMLTHRRQVRAMRDLRIEQEQLAQRLRGLRDDF